jgi:pyridoxine/pyridoxamine 5'-phosphate oxidase
MQQHERGLTVPNADRPHMPGYGITEGATGLLDWRHVSERMTNARSYWVCTTRPDGRPHAAPVWGVWVDEELYFGTDPGSVKGRNLAANPALVVHLESGDDCVIIEGDAVPVVNPDAEKFARITAAYAAKYDGIRLEYPTGPGTYTVRPRTVFAWLERDFPTSATRWHFMTE